MATGLGSARALLVAAGAQIATALLGMLLMRTPAGRSLAQASSGG